MRQGLRHRNDAARYRESSSLQAGIELIREPLHPLRPGTGSHRRRTQSARGCPFAAPRRRRRPRFPPARPQKAIAAGAAARRSRRRNPGPSPAFLSPAGQRPQPDRACIRGRRVLVAESPSFRPGARRPSTRTRTRCMRAAISGACVTMTKLVPSSRLSSSISSNTPRAFCPSRLPVGSSASTSLGRVTSARATAARCRSPPESCAGRCVESRRRDRRVRGSRAPSRPPHPPACGAPAAASPRSRAR